MSLKTLLSSSAAIAISMALTPAAFAQDAEEEQANEGPRGLAAGEILVTARKRAESADDTPVTLTVITEDLIKDANLNSAADVAALTPGFEFETNGSARDALPSIRGVTNNSVFVSFRESSAFLDGWFLTGTTTPPPFIDIARVEVLKGPQSAAFGRATYSGAVSYITVDPTDEFDVEGRFEAANQDTYQMAARVGGPIIPGKLYAQVAAHFSQRGGNEEWVNADGIQLGDQQQEYISGKLIFRPVDAVELEARYSYVEFDESPPATRLLPGSSRVSDPEFAGSDYFRGAIPFREGEFDIDFSQISDPGNVIAKHNAYITATIDLPGDHTLFLGGAYNEENTTAWEGDADGRRTRSPAGSGIPDPGGGFGSRFNQFRNDYQFEARIESSPTQAFRYLAGFYYIDSVGKYYLDQPVTERINFSFTDEFVQSYSPFAAIEYDVTDRLTLGFEGRYNIDDLRFVSFSNCFIFSPNSGSCPFGGFDTRVEDLTEEGRFEAFVYRATADYRLTDDLLLYALTSYGNQPGRFNLNDQLPPDVAEQFLRVDEQSIQNYEIGIKGSAWNNRLRFTLAGFYMDITDQQATNTVEVVQGDGTTFSVTGVVNAGSAETYGFEFETSVEPTDGLLLGGNVAYINSKYTLACSDRAQDITGIDNSNLPIFDDVQVASCQDVSGNFLPFQPQWSGSLYGSYETQSFIEDFNWFLRGDLFYTDRKFLDESNFAWLPSATVVNMRTGLRNENYTIEAFVSNLTDEDVPTRARSLADNALPAANRINASIVERIGRRYGVRVLVSF